MIAAMIRFGTPLPSDIDERLQRVARKLADDPRVDAVWLFGSRARGEADALSDVDIAVLAAERPSKAELDRCHADCLAAAVLEIGSDDVTLVLLNSAPVAFRYGALKDARLLWARRPELAADFEAHTLKEYLDFKPVLDEYDRELFAQAASGRLR